MNLLKTFPSSKRGKSFLTLLRDTVGLDGGSALLDQLRGGRSTLGTEPTAEDIAEELLGVSGFVFEGE